MLDIQFCHHQDYHNHSNVTEDYITYDMTIKIADILSLYRYHFNCCDVLRTLCDSHRFVTNPKFNQCWNLQNEIKLLENVCLCEESILRLLHFPESDQLGLNPRFPLPATSLLPSGYIPVPLLLLGVCSSHYLLVATLLLLLFIVSPKSVTFNSFLTSSYSWYSFLLFFFPCKSV